MESGYQLMNNGCSSIYVTACTPENLIVWMDHGGQFTEFFIARWASSMAERA